MSRPPTPHLSPRSPCHAQGRACGCSDSDPGTSGRPRCGGSGWSPRLRPWLCPIADSDASARSGGLRGVFQGTETALANGGADARRRRRSIPFGPAPRTSRLRRRPARRRPAASGTRRTRRRARPARTARAPRRSPRRAFRPPRRWPARRRSRDTLPWCSHCQTWEREISEVAASSIRLKIATAPEPRSHAARYWIPTETSLCRPVVGDLARRGGDVQQVLGALGHRPRAAPRAGSAGRRGRGRRSRAPPARGRDGRPRCRRSPGRPRAPCPRAPSRAPSR